MTETKQKSAKTFTPDLSTPYASAMKMWQGEMERFFGAAEKNLEQSVAMQKRLLEEHSRFAEAQLMSTQSAMRVFTDGMQRLTTVSTDA